MAEKKKPAAKKKPAKRKRADEPPDVSRANRVRSTSRGGRGR